MEMVPLVMSMAPPNPAALQCVHAQPERLSAAPESVNA
jgi:hypothetical protein